MAEDFHLGTIALESSLEQITRTYLIQDHLGTPRWAVDDYGTQTWRWQSDGFGADAPNDDPDADGYQTNINQRFPGQYWDFESGLNYNWNRYYDAETGRYVTSDPIGLDGGMNTFGYAYQNPIFYTDVEGLSGSRSGGPYHPPDGVKTACRKSDSCSTLKGKMYILKRMINSHQGWDRHLPKPRGGNRHSQEIAELWRAYAKCESIYSQKCKKSFCERNPKTCTTGVIVGIGLLCITPIPGDEVAAAAAAAGAGILVTN